MLPKATVIQIFIRALFSWLDARLRGGHLLPNFLIKPPPMRMCLECIGCVGTYRRSAIAPIIWSSHLTHILDHKPCSAPAGRIHQSGEDCGTQAWFTLFVLLPLPSNVTICLRSVMFKVSRVVEQILADIRGSLAWTMYNCNCTVYNVHEEMPATTTAPLQSCFLCSPYNPHSIWYQNLHLLRGDLLGV